MPVFSSPWCRYRSDPWDPKFGPTSSEAGQFGYAGSVARLPSGRQHLDGTEKVNRSERARASQSAILAMLQHVDLTLADIPNGPKAPTSISLAVLDGEVARFRARKDSALCGVVTRLITDVEALIASSTLGRYDAHR